MAISLTHKFTSAKADGVDATRIQPSNWNDEHDLELATGRLLGRTTAGAGAAEEIAVSADLTLATLSLGLSFTVTAFAKTLLDDADAATMRTTLGLDAIDGTVIGGVTPAAGAFTSLSADNLSLSTSVPIVNFIDPGADTAYNWSRIYTAAGSLYFDTLNNSGAGVATDYLMTKNASGAVSHSWRIGGTEQMSLASGGFTVSVGGASRLVVVGAETGFRGSITALAGGQDIGSAFTRWSTIYLSNAPNVSSDARLKDDIRDLNEAERRAAAKIKARTFVMKDTGQRKVGYVAQEVIEAMDSEGLNAFEYGLISDGETYGVDYDAINAFRLG